MDTVKEGAPLVGCSLPLSVVPCLSTPLSVNGTRAPHAERGGARERWEEPARGGRSEREVGFTDRGLAPARLNK